MFVAYGCKLWLKLFSACMRAVGCFVVVIWLVHFIYLCVCVCVKPFRFAGAWQEMSPSNNSSELAGESPGQAALRNDGCARGGSSSSSCLQVARGCVLPLRWALVGSLAFSLPETIKHTEEWDISVGENCISHSFCIAYWIFWTVLRLIAVQNKTCFWEKGKTAEESLMLKRFWSSLSSVMPLVHDYIWQFEWNVQIWDGCAMRGAKKKFKSVCHVKFSEAN